MAKRGTNGQADTGSTTTDPGLSLTQQAAVECLIAGMNDQETADKVGCQRQSVNKWRNHHPAFRALLNARRVEVWDGVADQLRALVPKSLRVLETALESEEHGIKAALSILRTISIPLDSFDKRTEDEILRDAVKAESVHTFDHLLTGYVSPTEMRKKMLARVTGEEE